MRIQFDEGLLPLLIIRVNMAQVLAIKSSILGDHSSSGLLINELLAQSGELDPHQQVVVRDLGAQPLAPLDGEILGAFSRLMDSMPVNRLRWPYRPSWLTRSRKAID